MNKINPTELISVFEDGFIFRLGQKVQTKFPGRKSGIVASRLLIHSAPGIHREYIVRHDADESRFYMEYELDEAL